MNRSKESEYVSMVYHSQDLAKELLRRRGKSIGGNRVYSFDHQNSEVTIILDRLGEVDFSGPEVFTRSVKRGKVADLTFEFDNRDDGNVSVSLTIDEYDPNETSKFTTADLVRPTEYRLMKLRKILHDELVKK